MYIYIADSLCSTVEISATTLESNSTPTKINEIKTSLHNMWQSCLVWMVRQQHFDSKDELEEGVFPPSRRGATPGVMASMKFGLGL